MKACCRAGYDAYQMDHERELGIDWVGIRRKHMKSSERYDALAQPPRAPSSRDTPAPWSAEARRGGRPAAQAPWAAAKPSGVPDQWRGWQ
eukprot:1394851-Pyramimonas_sp.AAC.1